MFPYKTATPTLDISTSMGSHGNARSQLFIIIFQTLTQKYLH